MALPSTLRGEVGRTIDEDFKIVRLLPDAQAVVSVKGLCRLVIQPAGRVLFEFVTREFAHNEIALPMFAREGEWEEAIDYETGKVLNFDNRGLSDDRDERVQQIRLCSGIYEGRDSIKVQRKTYHRVKGFKLGRLLPGPAKKRREAVKLFKPANERKRPFRSASKKHAS